MKKLSISIEKIAQKANTDLNTVLDLIANGQILYSEKLGQIDIQDGWAFADNETKAALVPVKYSRTLDVYVGLAGEAPIRTLGIKESDLSTEFYALYDSEKGLCQVMYADDAYPAQDRSGNAIFVTKEQATELGLYIDDANVDLSASQASNYAAIFDSGNKDQARKLAENMSLSKLQDWENESTVFVFEDGSAVFASGSEFRVATAAEMS